ncbi:MAG: hypothetical protein QF382_02110, partial [Acidimicrobiales bacterium]|nr:hypothetical protein [Acidimicrobiales bacterium]
VSIEHFVAQGDESERRRPYQGAPGQALPWWCLFGAAVLVMAGLLITPTSLHGPIAVIGGVRGALVPLAIVTLLAADRVSVANTGIANGLWFSIAEIGGVSGPLVTGALADTDASYEAALLTIAVIASLGGLVALRSHRHRIST